jgi:spoIIIJ-associated protein
MSETVEATGRTLEEAKRAAAAALGVSPENCDFELLESGAKGLFAKANYKVRATVRSAGPTDDTTANVAAVEVPVEVRAEVPVKTPIEEPISDPRRDGEAEAESEPAEEVAATDEDARTAAAMVQGIFDSADVKVDAEIASLTGRYINLRLTGPDTGLFVSPRNPVLDSLQYLCNAMYSRLRPGGTRITLDAKEYRQKRTEALEKLAQQVAEQVVSRKQEAVLDALPAHERRIVHRALADFEGVETYSEGEEPSRRVVISPKTQ